jgi:CHAP domain
MTIFTKQQLLDKYLGKGFDPDNYASIQCFDAPIQVARDMTGDNSFYCYVVDDKVANWALNDKCRQTWLEAGFEYEANDFANPNQMPPVGAFIVFNTTAYNGWYGHTGIFIEGQAGINNFVMMDQNARGNNEPMTLNNYGYDNVLGWFYVPTPIDFTKPVETQTEPSETDKALEIIARYSNDFPELTKDWVKARFQIDGVSAGVELILHDICTGYKKTAIDLNTQLAKAKSDNAALLVENTQLRNIPIFETAKPIDKTLSTEDKSLINGQDKAKSTLNFIQGWVKNNISVITTTLGGYGVLISQDQTSQIANGLFMGAGFLVSLYFEIKNRK